MATKLGIENVKQARDYIAALPEEVDGHFSMDKFFHGCGTPACAAGHLADAGMFGLTPIRCAFGGVRYADAGGSFSSLAAALSITFEDADDLFNSIGDSALDSDIPYLTISERQLFIERCNLWLERNEA